MQISSCLKFSCLTAQHTATCHCGSNSNEYKMQRMRCCGEAVEGRHDWSQRHLPHAHVWCCDHVHFLIYLYVQLSMLHIMVFVCCSSNVASSLAIFRSLTRILLLSAFLWLLQQKISLVDNYNIFPNFVVDKTCWEHYSILSSNRFSVFVYYSCSRIKCYSLLKNTL